MKFRHFRRALCRLLDHLWHIDGESKVAAWLADQPSLPSWSPPGPDESLWERERNRNDMYAAYNRAVIQWQAADPRRWHCRRCDAQRTSAPGPKPYLDPSGPCDLPKPTYSTFAPW